MMQARDAVSAKRLSGVLELVFAGSLWGFGFVAAIWGLQAWGPMTLTALRFSLALIVGYSVSLMIPSLRSSISYKNLKLAFIPGMLLCGTLLLQTWGLKYTSATKSSFITCFYVLAVPILELIWLRRRLPRYHFVFVLLALFGLALICDLASLWRTPEALGSLESQRQHWNIGDLLTLACALCASGHILWFAFIHEKIESSFVFNLSQTTWALLPVALLSCFETQPRWEQIPSLSIAGLCSLAFGSTLIAFALQIRAQKSISPSLAALLFLLESPFATIFAIIILGETLRPFQWLGAALILVAVIGTTLLHSPPIPSPPPE